MVEVGEVIEVFDRIMLDEDQRVQHHFVLIDYLCPPSGGCLAAASDAYEMSIVDPAALAPWRVTAKAESVGSRGAWRWQKKGEGISQYSPSPLTSERNEWGFRRETPGRW